MHKKEHQIHDTILASRPGITDDLGWRATMALPPESRGRRPNRGSILVRSRYRRVDARTGSGLPYAYWTRDLPPIPTGYLESVVYLYPSQEAAMAGEKVGGSGFLASVDLIHDQAGAYYIVTNRHVADKAVARLTIYSGGIEVFETPAGGWHHHPDGDDLSVFPLDLSPRDALRFSAIPWKMFVRPTNAISAGDDVFFLGRFFDFEGKQSNTPIARFGHVAMPGTERVPTPRGIDQESFLVEVLSLSGYSGSPVVVFRLQLEQRAGAVKLSVGEPADRGKYQVGQAGRPVLLGIDWGHFYEKAKVRGPDGCPTPDKLYVKQNRGIAGVVPAWKITELLQTEELEEMRKSQREERERERRTSDTALDSAEEAQPEIVRPEGDNDHDA